MLSGSTERLDFGHQMAGLANQNSWTHGQHRTQAMIDAGVRQALFELSRTRARTGGHGEPGVPVWIAVVVARVWPQ